MLPVTRLRKKPPQNTLKKTRSDETGSGADLSYWLLLRDPSRINELVTEVRDVNGVSNVSSIQADDESEV